MTDTPMLDKLAEEKWKTELIHEFLEFVGEKGALLGEWAGDYFGPLSSRTVDSLMAQFIGIDLNVVEAEKRQLLEEVRQKNVV